MSRERMPILSLNQNPFYISANPTTYFVLKFIENFFEAPKTCTGYPSSIQKPKDESSFEPQFIYHDRRIYCFTSAQVNK